jgi:hypothetical protein
MQRTTHNILTALIGAVVCTLAMHGVWAKGAAADGIAQAGDPARWYQEDITPRARFETLKREAGAAHREAQNECKKAERIARVVCMQEARNALGRDLATARQQAQSPHS